MVFDEDDQVNGDLGENWVGDGLELVESVGEDVDGRVGGVFGLELVEDVLDGWNEGDNGWVGRVGASLFFFDVLVEPQNQFLLKREVSSRLSPNQYALHQHHVFFNRVDV